jgi:hypothetical protein
MGINRINDALVEGLTPFFLRRKNERAIVPRIHFGAQNFMSTHGSPSLAVLSLRWPGWALDAAADEGLAAAYPYDGAHAGQTLVCTLSFAMISASSGNVYMMIGASAVANGESTSDAAVYVYATISVPSTSGVLKMYEQKLTLDYSPGDMIRVILRRYGSNAADTASGDMYVLGMHVAFE